MAGFHQRSVNDNSWLTMTYQQGWVLTTRVGNWQGRISADDGPHSARLVWLNQALPEHAKLNGRDYENIGLNKREARKRATPEQAALIEAAMRADQAGVIELIDAADLSRELTISSWPINVIFNTQYYLGLPKAQKMMVGAFLEAVKAHPESFVASVAVGIKGFLTFRAISGGQISSPKDPNAACQLLPPTGADYSREQIDSCVDHQALVIRITSLMTPSSASLCVAVAIASGLVAASFLLRGFGELKTVVCAAIACLFAQAVFSAIVFGSPRIKEQFTAYPITLSFIGLTSALFTLIAVYRLRRVSTIRA
jgi:hypothetical protein